MSKKILERFAERVGYSPTDLEHFQEGDPRLRQIEKLAKAAPRFSIEAKVVKSRHCNSGYQVGDRFILDIDGNFITKLCPQKICVYLASQLRGSDAGNEGGSKGQASIGLINPP
jgi:hypothetical protein